MSYWIMIFTQHPLGRFHKEDVLTAITEANFSTLCNQYGLDPGQIQPALDQLTIETSEVGSLPFFFLRYQPFHRPPIVVTEWAVAAEAGSRLLAEVGKRFPTPYAGKQLVETRFIYSVELVESQLSDMGLLLAYEMSRWVLMQSTGIMLGLDRTWYRLNPYQAFIPQSRAVL
jgi:hypothetical protein